MNLFSFKSFYKTIKNNGWYSGLSMLSLVLGLVSFIFIAIYVYGELTYDHHHKNKDRIYRVGLDLHTENGIEKFPFSGMPFGPTIKQDVPAIEEFVRFSRIGSRTFIKDNENLSYKEVDDLYLADSTVFKIFTHRFLQGNPLYSLEQPNSIVLTESFSKKNKIQFGDVITLKGLNNKDVNCKVTGIIEDLKESSFLKFNGLIAMSTYPQFLGKERFDYLSAQHKRPACVTFFMFKEKFHGNDARKYFDTYLKKYMNNHKSGMRFNVNCLQLSDLHFSKGFTEDFPKGNYSSIVILCIIGFLVLLVSCINYVNMEIALSLKKHMEIAIKKIHGAKKKHIRLQYLVHSTLFTFLGLIISLFIVSRLAGYYSVFTGKEFLWELLISFKFVLFVFILSVIIGFLSGSYTSYYLSRVNALKILNRNNKNSQGKNSFASILVLVQLIICLGTVFSTIVISKQYEFLTNKDLGFNPDNIINISITEDKIKDKITQLKDELKNENYILNASSSSNKIGDRYEIFVKQGNELKSYLTEGSLVDEEFINVLDLKLIDGRNFSKNRKTDYGSSCIINETMAKKLGWGKDALGKQIFRNNEGKNPFTVVGVVKDFHSEKLNNNIGPFIFFMVENPNYLTIRYKEGNEGLIIDKIQSKISEFGSDLPIDYSFLSKEIKDKYKDEKTFNSLFRIFAFLAIFISLIGIIGITSHNIRIQLKDIAIKKIIGASIPGIFSEYIYRIVKLLSFAILLVLPLSYYLLNKWLDGYAYKMSIGLSHVSISIFIILLVVVAATVFSLRGLIYVNPVKLITDE